MKLIAITAFTAAALAVAFPQAGQAQDRPDLKHAGLLAAQGRGRAEVKGSGVFSAWGNGDVVVTAKSRDDIKVEGLGFTRQEGSLYFFHGKGKITVKGREIGFVMEDNIAGIKCEGQGIARFVGNGTYRTKADKGHWSDKGIDAKFGPKKN